MLKACTSLLLCAAMLSSAAERPATYRVKYAGGSLSDVKTGQDLLLWFENGHIMLKPPKGKFPIGDIPAKTVTEVSYGQDVHRRIGTAVGLAVISLGVGALVAFSKSKKHFIGIVWDASEQQKGGVVFQADKSEYRGIIAALEGFTGKTAVDTDKGKPSS